MPRWPSSSRLPWLAVVAGLLLVPEVAHAAVTSVPRGPGFYFHPVKVVLVLGLYLLWVYACSLLTEDAENVGVSAGIWNTVLTFGGLLALLFAWALPFPIGFPVGCLLFLTAGFAYVTVRNERVNPAERIFTPRHLRLLAKRYLGIGGDIDEEDDAPRKKKEGKVGLRFVSKDMHNREDKKRSRDVEDSPEYQAAVELVREAIQQGATDIHMEPTRDEMIVRLRLDGILQAMAPFTRERGDSVLNIYKVLADLNITEKRRPQDGSFSAEYTEPIENGTKTRMIDFRASTTGSTAGEKLVLRLLDKAMATAHLPKLGMAEKMVTLVRRLVMQPHGMFIVCGPTGAGKSTTLYACLAQLDAGEKNVITLENPVEYRIEHATQIEINPRAGKTFAGELRSILRQDPDVIYIGEIRDQETAEIGCQAAQTGHLVLTTIHANDTVGALARMMDLKVPVYMIATAITGVLSQRLVRLLCPKCKQAYEPKPEVLAKMGLSPGQVKRFYRAKESRDADGPVCKHCDGRGYKGRTGVYELLILTDKMRKLLKQDPPDIEGIREEAAKGGTKFLLEAGFKAVIEGRTSIQELLRVCA